MRIADLEQRIWDKCLCLSYFLNEASTILSSKNLWICYNWHNPQEIIKIKKLEYGAIWSDKRDWLWKSSSWAVCAAFIESANHWCQSKLPPAVLLKQNSWISLNFHVSLIATGHRCMFPNWCFICLLFLWKASW